jgi:hypothetical protein
VSCSAGRATVRAVAWEPDAGRAHDFRWYESGRATAWLRRQGGPAFRDPGMPPTPPPPYRQAVGSATGAPVPTNGMSDGANLALAAGRTAGNAALVAGKVAVKSVSAYWRFISKILD